MSTVVNNYIPEEGIMAFSNVGNQRVTSVYDDGFNYQSRVGVDILPQDRNSIDSCWETGNIYYIENGDVYKSEYNGDAIASISTSNASSISISQAFLPMALDPAQFREDNGCWIVKNTDGELVKTDFELNIITTSTNFPDPQTVISSDVDGGCYLFDDSLQWIMKCNFFGEVTAYIPYASVSSSLLSADDAKRSVVDHVGDLWVLIGNTILKIELSNGGMFKTLALSPLANLGLSADNSLVSDFDIEKNATTANIYVTGGCKNTAWLAKYNLNGVLTKSSKNIQMEHPVAIKVTQYSGSSGIYIITESAHEYLPEECVSSSSSSSSSSSYGYSSSSSISSSSSSSTEIPCCDRWETQLPNPGLDFVFPNWDLYGLIESQIPSCRIWAEFSYDNGTATQTLYVYKGAIKQPSNLIASGSLASSVAGGIPITDENGSGVSGTVEWYWNGVTHPSSINAPGFLYELGCIESSSSSSSDSTSSSSSSSSEGYTSTSSSSYVLYDCDEYTCDTPTGGSANACSVLTDWDINGTTNSNTRDGSMVAKMYHNGSPSESPPSTYRLDVYSADTVGPDPNGPVVATSGDFTWTSQSPVTVAFSEVSGSGLAGDVIWGGYTGTIINENYTRIICPEELSSSSSSSSE